MNELENEIEKIKAALRAEIRYAEEVNERLTDPDDLEALSDDDAAAIRCKAAAEYLLDTLIVGTEAEKLSIVRNWKEGRANAI